MFENLRPTLIQSRDRLAALAIVTRSTHGIGLAKDAALWRDFRALLQGDDTVIARWPAAELARLARSSQTVFLAAAHAPALASQLAPTIRRARQVDALLGLGAERAAQALRPLEGLKVALLKGSATGVLCWDEPAARQRQDLDLLVRPEDFKAVRAALWNAGWRDSPDPETGGPPFSGRTFGMRLKVGGASVSLDLHRDLVKPAWCGLAGPRFRTAFLDGAISGPAPLPVTNHLHTFLHTVAHIVHAGFRLPLKAFVDLVRLLPHLDDETLAAGAAVWGLRTATWACLTVVERWFQVQRPGLLAQLAPGMAKRWVLQRILAGEGASAERVPSPRWTAIHGFPVLLADG
jgi:hypothetical protein